jgi:hypothetical protein
MDNKAPHGQGVRGINLPRSSLSFEGNFGRLFRALPPADFGANDAESEANLKTLARSMLGSDSKEKDGADPEESGIPALYTYLGQFVDHDLTFDPSSSLQQQNDVDGLVDYRTPRFDLDNVYGRGPDDQPYLYQPPPAGQASATFLEGTPLTGGTLSEPPAADLPRSAGTPGRAIIGDPRNDENVIVSQLQGLFFKFHNRLARDRPRLSFAQVQREVRFHYQWLLIHDFLPTLINKPVLEAVFPHLASGASLADARPKLEFYHARNDAFMPLEFSAAAYRFGHSMVRPGYRLNDSAHLPIFGGEGKHGRPQSLRGFMAPEPGWGIDWARFIDIEDRPNGVMVDNGKVVGTDSKPSPAQLSEMKNRLQLAYRIDTSMVKPLADLPPDVADAIMRSLIQRNLTRGWRLRLPSGQDVARAMGLAPIDTVPIGQFVDGSIVDNSNSNQLFDLNTKSGFEVFRDNCPLWVYVLAETSGNAVPGKFNVKSRLLGPVGGRIVAETFAGLLVYDSHSFLNINPRWQPSLARSGKFGLKEWVLYALGR